ncbi:hypothetical protein KAJ83_12460 [Marivibrio halodurans]|uniref:Uncharacterized protein n=1 Tax=Marivibrio halodurans TaxID=2039722 RepID=A0A8J7V4L8_9PROT|nr:hypothetical protein [Marivibrio halodurans]MBP5857824.1 hypothetical protein [Marivibrio halodurans]
MKTCFMRGLVCLLLVLGPVACQTTDPITERMNQSYLTLLNASSIDTPDVQEALAWLEEPASETRRISLSHLIYQGTHPDIIMALVDIYGVDTLFGDKYQRLFHDYIFDTPYAYGNAFQLAVSASRPELAERIAIHAAKQAGDYREGLPLGAIPSVATMASQTVSQAFWQGRGHFQHLRHGQDSWAEFYSDEATMRRVNAQPHDTYVNPPGRGLLFRFAATMRPGWAYDTIRRHGWPPEDVYPRLESPTTITIVDYDGDLARAYEKELTERATENLQFVLKNFGGDVNERLPYCMMREGEPVIVCPTVSPVHLAARNTTMRDSIHQLEWLWLPAGKFQAFMSVGGDPNQPDSYGITPVAYARSGGQHPGATDHDDDFDIGQLFAGAAIVAGAGMIAGEGGYDRAAGFLAGGMADVIDGTPDNLVAMQQQAMRETSQSNGQSNGRSGGQEAGQGGAAGGATAQAARTLSFGFTCPETGRSHSIPITAASGACRRAMERYARAASCNMIDDLPGAEKAYYSACASEMY